MSADTDPTTAVLDDAATADAALEAADEAIAEALEAASALAECADEVVATTQGDVSDAPNPSEETPAAEEVASLVEPDETPAAEPEADPVSDMDEAVETTETVTADDDLTPQPEADVDPTGNADPNEAAVTEADGAIEETEPQPDTDAAPTAEESPTDSVEPESTAATEPTPDADADAAATPPDGGIPREQLIDRLKVIRDKVARVVARVHTLEQESQDQTQTATEARGDLARARSENEALKSRVKQLTGELARHRDNEQAHATLDEIEQDLETVDV